MRTITVCKNKIDITALLLLAAAVLMLAGCAGGTNTASLSKIPGAHYEPITVVAFNTVDPYALRMQGIAPAAGHTHSPVFIPARP